uniref:Uncharacterized protein n=1 Tax=Rhizophora mucronata TaxID=61149 RepID=A0A2P2N3U6_RHIMU
MHDNGVTNDANIHYNEKEVPRYLD